MTIEAMTVERLIESAQQAIRQMEQEDSDNLDAINTWANAAQAYAAVAQAMVQAAWLAERNEISDPVEAIDAAIYDANIAQWRNEMHYDRLDN